VFLGALVPWWQILFFVLSEWSQSQFKRNERLKLNRNGRKEKKRNERKENI
jgi:hypothetical protein